MRSVFINLHGDTNMTAAYLHSLIDKSGFDIKTIHFRRLLYELDLPSKSEMSALINLVNKIEPEVVMMSVNSMSFWIAIEITRLLRGKIIVWGGVQSLIDPERCLDYADIIIRGEGEAAVLELLTAIRDKKPIDKIKNVWVKKNGKIIKNDFRPLIPNLDSLPYPDFTDKNKFYVLGDRVYKTNPLPHSKYEYNITFSRGCPFSCKYCLNHFLNKTFKHKYLRRRSVNSAINELVLAKKNFPKLKAINFWDDVFMMDTNWVREFVKEYRNKINLPFFAYGNATFVNEENIRLLKEAGISFFDLGVQSGCQMIRNEIFGRQDTNEQIISADRIIHKYKILVGYDVIFSEFETEKSMEEGLDFFLKLKKPFKVQRNKLAYYPNFEITKRAINEKRITLDNVASMNPKINTQVINREQAEKTPLMNYYYFLGKKIIPNYFVSYMLKSKWHYKYPKFLVIVGDVINRLEDFQFSFKSMFRMILRGELKYVFNRIFNKDKFLK